MEAFVTIGSVGLDLIHLVLVLAVIGLAVGLFVVRGQLEARAANARRDLYETHFSSVLVPFEDGHLSDCHNDDLLPGQGKSTCF